MFFTETLQAKLRWLPQPAKNAIKSAGSAFLKTREHFVGEPQQAALLFAHMRSGSTLLHHLLISHPEIIGRGERNEKFADSRDLDKLKLDVYLHRGEWFRGHRFVAAQINHNRFLKSEALLNHPRVRPIFLIREPHASVASMVRVLDPHYGTTVEQATDYYADRLNTLRRYAGQIQESSRAIFLTYDDLILNTEATLLALQSFLGLSTRLSEEYRLFDFTGARGDPSPHIMSGRILRQRAEHQIDLDRKVLDRLRKVYADCEVAMRSACTSMPASRGD